jgi:hypothetical protein
VVKTIFPRVWHEKKWYLELRVAYSPVDNFCHYSVEFVCATDSFMHNRTPLLMFMKICM